MENEVCANDDDPFWANECYQLRSEYAAFPDHLWQTRDDKTYAMLCIEEFMAARRKLEAIKEAINDLDLSRSETYEKIKKIMEDSQVKKDKDGE